MSEDSEEEGVSRSLSRLELQFGLVSFLSSVLSQGATDIREEALIGPSSIHPTGGYRQRKRQQLFLH